VPDGVFGVEVVTPEKALVAGPATAVMLRTSTGEMTVLDGHTALVGDVVPGLVRVEQPDGTLLRLAVHGGFIQVDTRPGAADDLVEGGEGGPLPGMTTRVTLLAGVTELAGDIDVPRAERAQEAAAQRVSELQAGRAGPAGDLEGESGGADLQQAEAALARAELRLSVAAGAA
jgi:F-type H+-transporting ATPase subunit epsilon